MSRVGKKPISVPQDVSVMLEDGSVVVRGPKGTLRLMVFPDIGMKKENGLIRVVPRAGARNANSRWGLTRALIANMILGVSDGYQKRLQLEGVGYRASIEGNDLILSVGHSHTIRIPRPEGIQFSIEKNIITVSGIDKQLVGETAAAIRRVRKPEPYKGTGIRYENEVIRRKAGKKAVGAG